MIRDPRDDDKSEASNPTTFLSPWEGGYSSPTKAMLFFGIIVSLTLAPLFMLDDNRINAFAESFVLLGG